jgi:hypothetical protein
MHSSFDNNFYEKYINPIYGHLMGHSQIFNLPQAAQDEFIKEFTRIKNEIDEENLKKMLFDVNWRCNLVSAWLIFSGNRLDFSTSVGNLLLQGKAGVVGFCYVLSKFENTESIQFLLEYLKKELQFDKFPDEKFQDIAYLALLHIDKQTGQNNINEIRGLWDRFLNAEFTRGFKLEKSAKWGNIESQYCNFVKMYNFVDSI